jgi:hypothetical protein
MREKKIGSHLKAWERSGLTLVEYSRRAGIACQTLYNYRSKQTKRLKERNTTGPLPVERFTEIPVRISGSEKYVLRCGAGVCLEIPSQIPVDELVYLVSGIVTRSGGKLC